mgnify:CR=1 FL=1
MKSLSDLGEDALVDRLASILEQGEDVLVGPGDDCAVLQPHSGRSGGLRLLKVDCVVEGVHYLASEAPSRVGHKAIARALSDIAAMGGRPAHALVTLVLPPERTVSYASALYRGLGSTAREYGVSVVGGETARPAPGGGGMVSVTLTGQVHPDHLCLRSGGEPGDRLFVTGRLGGSIRGRHLRFAPRLPEAAWLARNTKPSAMIDLSDGLGTDLPRLAKASSCGWEIDLGALPRQKGCDVAAALSDGEDYELLFAIPAARAGKLTRSWQKRFPDLALSEIGILAKAGKRVPELGVGWTHY